MASHFMHLLLACESLDRVILEKDDALQFLAGALLPDAAEFGEKKQTHFTKSRWKFKADPESFAWTFLKLPFWLRKGWEIHLDLDRMWQRSCLWANFYRVPGLLLRNGARLSSKYYEELSGFDVLLRRKLPAARITLLEETIERLFDYELPEGIPIKCDRWRDFLQSLKFDLSKEKVYQGPPIVGWERFEKFYRKSTQMVAYKLENQ